MPDKKPQPEFRAEDEWIKALSRNCKTELAKCQQKYPHEKSLIVPYGSIAKSGVGGIRISEDILDAPGKAIEECQGAVCSGHLIRKIDPVMGTHSGDPAADIIPRFVGLPRRTLIKNIRQKHLDKMVAIEVQVKRVSSIAPRCTMAVFQCGKGHFTHKTQPLMRFVVPDSCATDNCTMRRLNLVPARSTFTDTQRIQVQEVSDNLSGGEQAQSMSAELMGDLVGKVFPGDRVVINAIVRSHQKYSSGLPTPTFNVFLEVNSIEIFEREYEEIHISEEDEAAITALAKNPDILEKISASIMPSIHGFEDVKKAYSLALFSGRQEIDKRGNASRMDINVMVAGDPSIAKTKLAKAVVKISPRGVFTSGNTSTKAGLTVTVTKDEGTDGRWVAEAGAAVLADLGILAVDEANLLPKGDINSLNEAMESQTVSIAKAGLVATLNCRCSTLTLLNPKYGRFENTEDLADQIDIPPAMLSRNDLIYLKTDIPNEQNDLDIATAILDCGEMVTEEIPLDLLRKYVAHTKKQPNPKLTGDAKARIIRYYATIRSKVQAGKAIPLTARSVESLKRLAVAHAKMRLSTDATIDDAELAIKMLEGSLKGIAWDESTGTYDIDKFSGTPSYDKRTLHDNILHALAQLGAEVDPVHVDRLMEEMAKRNVKDELKIGRMITELLRSGDIFEAVTDYYRIPRRKK